MMIALVLLLLAAVAITATVEFYDNPKCAGKLLGIKNTFGVDGHTIESRCEEDNTTTTRTTLSRVCFDPETNYCVGAQLIGPNGACLPVTYVFWQSDAAYKVDTTGLWAIKPTCDEVDSRYRAALRFWDHD